MSISLRYAFGLFAIQIFAMQVFASSPADMRTASTCLRQISKLSNNNSNAAFMKSLASSPDTAKKTDAYAKKIAESFEEYAYNAWNFSEAYTHVTTPQSQKVKDLALQCRQFLDRKGKYTTMYYKDAVSKANADYGDSFPNSTPNIASEDPPMFDPQAGQPGHVGYGDTVAPGAQR